jgi:hypothetical protein
MVAVVDGSDLEPVEAEKQREGIGGVLIIVDNEDTASRLGVWRHGGKLFRDRTVGLAAD